VTGARWALLFASRVHPGDIPATCCLLPACFLPVCRWRVRLLPQGIWAIPWLGRAPCEGLLVAGWRPGRCPDGLPEPTAASVLGHTRVGGALVGRFSRVHPAYILLSFRLHPAYMP